MGPSRRSVDLPDVLAFMQGLWAVVHRMERLSKQMGAAGGVTGPQRLVLRLIGLFPGISAGDLATTLHLHPSTLTGVLRRLEAHAFLTRSIDPDDRRRAVFTLTRRGRQVSGGTRGTVEAAVTAALGDAPVAHQAATRGLLERLATALDAQLEQALPRRG